MNLKKRPIVVGIGEILWDMLPTGKQAGGAPINFVYHAAALGAKGYAISAVGNDTDGDDILFELNKNKINHIISRTSYPTGKVLVELKNGIPSYNIVENVAWDYIPYSPEAEKIIRKADAVCFGTLASRNLHSRNTIIHLLNETQKNAIKFFDVNLRNNYYSPQIIDNFLHLANVFKINDDEITQIQHIFNLTGSNDDICLSLLKKYHLKYLIFTAGEKYSVIYSNDEISRLPTPKVNVIDTVGAGDAFSGAFIYSILTGKTLTQAHHDAVRISAFVCTFSGAWPKYSSDMKGQNNE